MAGKWNVPLTEEDRHFLSLAVAEAEKKTDGEIVPMIVSRSTSGRTAEWVMSLILFLLIEPVLFLLTKGDRSFLGLALTAGAFLVWFVPRPFFRCFPSFERLFIHPRDQAFAVEIRAQLELERARIRNTQRGTGILIMVSWLERRAVILGDTAIAVKIDEGSWSQLLQPLLTEIRAGRVREGFSNCIHQVGQVLAQHFPAQQENPNEISNDLVIKD